MSGLIGGKTNASTTTKYTQLSIQTSAEGVPIPMLWGKKRMGNNDVWYADFQAVAEDNSGKKGSKGGDGKGAGGVVYDYFVAVILALCEGPITSVGTVWADRQITTLADLGLTLFTGTSSQAAWSYLTTNHPTQALAYPFTAYLANSKYSLGKSQNLPNHNFEIVTPLSGSMPGTPDVNMADVISDFLTNPQYSMGFASSAIDATSLAFYKTYTRAQGLFFSPDLTAQEQITSIIDRWAALTNSWIFWSGSALKFVPLGDTAITANGVTFTPNLTPAYALTYDDLIAQDPAPITVSRADPADAPNHIKLEIKDRANAYNAAVAEWKDQGLIDQFEMIDGPVSQAHEVCDLAVGQIVAQLVGQRAAYIRNTYAFSLGWEFCLLEPGDIVTLTDPHIGITDFPVRIVTLDEDDKGEWSVTAEEFPGAIGSVAGTQAAQASTNTPLNNGVDPGDVNPPAVFEPASSLTNGKAQIWIAASGGADWGGAIVHLSFDNVNYGAIGAITNPARQGLLTANLADHADPDTVNTLSVDLTQSQTIIQPNATHADADAFRTLVYVTAPYTTTIPSTGEVMAYGDTALGVGSFDFDLSYLRRGLYGTAHAAHSSGDFFTKVDLNAKTIPSNTLLIYDLPVAYIGGPIYLKFVSVNRFGNAPQDISTVTAYTYTPTGAGYGGGSGGVPITPTGLAASAGNQLVALTWTANASTDNVTSYSLFRAPGTGASFGSAVQIWNGNAPSYVDSGLGVSTDFTYFLVANNAAGASGHTAGVNATTTVNTKDWLLQGSQDKTFIPSTASFEIFRITAKGGEKLHAADASSWKFNLENAATANMTWPLTKNGVSVGSISVLATATTGTFTFPSDMTLASTDEFKLTWPALADATASGPSWMIFGTRT